MKLQLFPLSTGALLKIREIPEEWPDFEEKMILQSLDSRIKIGEDYCQIKITLTPIPPKQEKILERGRFR